MKAPAEATRDAAWGAWAVALLVAQQVTGKATRDALFLSHHAPASLPGVMIGASVVAIAAAILAGRLLANRAPRQVMPALVGANAALLLGQFVLASSAPRLAGVLLYLQIAATGGTLVSGFWSVTSERFDPWVLKGVMGRLGFGAALGGILGGGLALAASRYVPLLMLLPMTAGLNVLALVCLVRFAGDVTVAKPPEATTPSRPLGQMPYLRLLALLVALGSGVEVLLDYVLKAHAAASLTPQALVGFFAAYQAAVGLAGVLVQRFLTRPALSGLGLARTAALRPLYVALAAGLGLLDLRLMTAALARAGQDVLSNSLFRSAYELLFTPLPEGQKRSTKQVVDVAFDKVGALVGGALTLLAVRVLDAPDRALLFLACGVSVIAAGLTQLLHRGYVSTLEDGLRAGRVRLDPGDVVDQTTRLTMAMPALAGASSFGSGFETPLAAPTPVAPADDSLVRRIAELRSRDPFRIRAALREGATPLDPGLVGHLVPLLGRNDVALDAFRALQKLAPGAVGQIADAILDERRDPVVRRRLPRLLKAVADPRASEALLHGLDDAAFAVRDACGAALASQAARHPELRPAAPRVFSAVARELEEARSGASREARLAYVLTLLSIALDREAVQVAERALAGSDAALRGTALEYLETALPRELATGVLRLAGASGSAGGGGGAQAIEALKRMAERRRSLRRRD